MRVIGLVWCLGAGGAAAAESWIVAWKEHPSDSDASAQVFVCDRIQEAGEITWFHKGERKKSFTKEQFYRSARLEPGVPAELTTQEQFDLLTYNFTRLSDFAKQFPNANEVLGPRLVTMRKMIGNYEAGKIYSFGKWAPRKDNTAARSKPGLSQNTSSLHPGAAPRKDTNQQADEIQELQRRADLETQRLDALEHKQAETRKLAYTTVGGIAIYLVLLIGAILHRMPKTIVLLLLLPGLAAGWMRYQDGDFQWAKKLQKFLLELPSNLRLPDKQAPPTDNPP